MAFGGNHFDFVERQRYIVFRCVCDIVTQHLKFRQKRFGLFCSSVGGCHTDSLSGHGARCVSREQYGTRSICKYDGGRKRSLLRNCTVIRRHQLMEETSIIKGVFMDSDFETLFDQELTGPQWKYAV